MNFHNLDDLSMQEAIKRLISWIGDDPDRKELIDTPSRMMRAFKEWFSGYELSPKKILASKMFLNDMGVTQPIVVKNIDFLSHCEHHFAPIVGKAHIAYIPDKHIVGLSKIPRVVEALSKRLQIQERLTTQIANIIQEVLNPKGVAVFIKASHFCTQTRGIKNPSSDMITSHYTGDYYLLEQLRREFYACLNL